MSSSNSSATHSRRQTVHPNNTLFQHTVIPCIPEGIPAELRAYPQWVVWRKEPNPDPDGKPRKKLYDPKTGRPARTHDSAGKTYKNKASDTWGTCEQAERAFNTGKWSGIGFVFTEDDPFIGGDIDNCRNLETGDLTEDAQQVLTMVATYTEVSQSGTGVKFIGKAKKIGRRCNGSGVEMYETARYFALTGSHLTGTPTTIEPRQDAFAALYKQWFPERDRIPASVSTMPPSGLLPPKSDVSTPESLDDEVLLQRARNARGDGKRFSALFDAGDISAYNNNHSKADIALCGWLAFWTGKDPERMDRLFRQSALMRHKWDECHRGDGATYGTMTIEAAIRGQETVYTGRKPQAKCDQSPSDEHTMDTVRWDIAPTGAQQRLAEVLKDLPVKVLSGGMEVETADLALLKQIGIITLREMKKDGLQHRFSLGDWHNSLPSEKHGDRIETMRSMGLNEGDISLAKTWGWVASRWERTRRRLWDSRIGPSHYYELADKVFNIADQEHYLDIHAAVRRIQEEKKRRKHSSVMTAPQQFKALTAQLCEHQSVDVVNKILSQALELLQISHDVVTNSSEAHQENTHTQLCTPLVVTFANPRGIGWDGLQRLPVEQRETCMAILERQNRDNTACIVIEDDEEFIEDSDDDLSEHDLEEWLWEGYEQRKQAS